MCRTPAPPSTALVASSIWSGVGEVNTSPGHAASSIPRPTKPPCIGSLPAPPPETMPTLPLTGASARTTTYGSNITRMASWWAADIPSSASRTTASGSLMSFFICPPLLGTGVRSRHRIGARSVGSIRPAEREGLLRLAGSHRRVHVQHVAGRRGLAGRGPPLALPELADLRHHLAALRRVARRDRRPEADLDLDATGEEPPAEPLGPVLAGGHRLARPADPDRHDVQPVLRGDHGGARLDTPDVAVARARALGEDEQVPPVRDQLVHVIARAAVEPCARPAHGDRVEREGSGPRPPAGSVEVVGRSGDGRALAPGARRRAQDRRRVEVTGVVGHEDDGIRHLVVQHLATIDAVLDVPVEQWREDRGQDPAADDPSDRAARPRDVHLRVLARELFADLGAPRARAAAELGDLGACPTAGALQPRSGLLLACPAQLHRAIVGSCTPRLRDGFARPRP